MRPWDIPILSGRTGPGSLEAAAEAILSANKPLIVCGGGVVIAARWTSWPRPRLDIPVATSISARAALPRPIRIAWAWWDRTAARTRPGRSWRRQIWWSSWGCRAGSTTTSRWEAPDASTRIVHFDSDPMVIGANYRTEVGVVGDLRFALAELNAVLDRKGQGHGSYGGAASVAAAKRRKFDPVPRGGRRVIDADPAGAGDRRHDGCAARRRDNRLRPRHLVPVFLVLLRTASRRPPFHHQPCPWRAGLFDERGAGAWHGKPDRKVVAMMGDGSFGFSCGELETVIRSRAPITYIVLSNSSFGWIKAKPIRRLRQALLQCRLRPFRPCGHRLSVRGEILAGRGSDELAGILKEAVDHDGPTLIDVICQPLEESKAPVRRWMG